MAIRLVIGSREFQGFTVDNISLMYNAICSTYSFSGLKDFAPEPYTYPTIKIYKDEELILTGSVINTQYQHSAKPELVSISGYSKAGILEDCTIPKSAMPMQLDNMSLKEICEKLFPLYGLTFTNENSVATKFNKKIPKVNFDYDKSIKSLIIDLATEKAIYCNHLNDGNIHFTDSSTDNLTPEFAFNDTNTISMSLSYDGQAMHSEITVLGQTKSKESYNSEYTLTNPYVRGISRPIIHILKSGESSNVKDYARLMLSAELRSIVLKVETREFVKPGRLITVQSEKLNLILKTSFFVEQTDITEDANGEKYTLTCVLKDVFSVKPVKNIFQNEN